MRYREITPPTTHPYVATLRIDPADLRRLQRMTEDARELRVLDVNDSQADQWTVRIRCASQRVCKMVDDAWA